MKKPGIIFILTYYYFSALGQINSRVIAPEKKTEKPLIYDGSYYFMYNSFEGNTDELKQYIGQKIYILPISKSDKNREYYGFYSSLKPSETFWDLPYDSIARQYLTILDAEGQDYLKLLYRNKDTIYYLPPNESYFTSAKERIPFILTAFFENSKKKYMNQSFIQVSSITTSDVNNGEKLSFPKGQNWKCVDVTLVELENNEQDDFRYNTPVLVFKNSNTGNEILVNYITQNVQHGQFPKYIFNSGASGGTKDNRLTLIDKFYTIEEYKLSLMLKK